jgi:hypothetical protein
LFLPEVWQIKGAYICLLTPATCVAFSFPCVSILLARSINSTQNLGTVNGLASSAECLARACGLTLSGMIHSRGSSLGVGRLAMWSAGVVCAFGAIQSSTIQKNFYQTPQMIQTQYDTE